jgi:hypothetical protein
MAFLNLAMHILYCYEALFYGLPQEAVPQETVRIFL